jgi:mono/diheme cytochrome c family protein
MKRYVILIVLVILILVAWILVSPPRFWINWTKNVPISAESGAHLVAAYGCQNCHRINGSGALVGPDLDIILSYSDPLVVRMWLRNPKSMKKNTPMPDFHLSESEIEALMTYLASVQTP